LRRSAHAGGCQQQWFSGTAGRVSRGTTIAAPANEASEPNDGVTLAAYRSDAEIKHGTFAAETASEA
jgi:hypothetical protein